MSTSGNSLYQQSLMINGLTLNKIEDVKKDICVGDYVFFRRDGEEIEGHVKKKYPRIFLLSNGRTYTWVDYILGSKRYVS